MVPTRRSIIPSLLATAGFAAFDQAGSAAIEGKLNHDWRNRESYDADDGPVVDW
jgi:hypothetical protein